MTDERTCRTCGQSLPLSEFKVCHDRRRNSVYRSARCRPCRADADPRNRQRPAGAAVCRRCGQNVPPAGRGTICQRCQVVEAAGLRRVERRAVLELHELRLELWRMAAPGHSRDWGDTRKRTLQAIDGLAQVAALLHRPPYHYPGVIRALRHELQTLQEAA